MACLWLRQLAAILQGDRHTQTARDLVEQLLACLDEHRQPEDENETEGGACASSGERPLKCRKYLEHLDIVRKRLQDLEKEDGPEGINQHAVFGTLRAAEKCWTRPAARGAPAPVECGSRPSGGSNPDGHGGSSSRGVRIGAGLERHSLFPSHGRGRADRRGGGPELRAPSGRLGAQRGCRRGTHTDSGTDGAANQESCFVTSRE